MANSPHLSVLQMVSDYSLDNASKQRMEWWLVLWDTDYEWKAGSEWDLPLAAKSRWILTDWSGQRHDLAIRSSSAHLENPTNLFTLLQTHFWWDWEFIKSGPICWLIHFIRSTLWTDHSGIVQCAFFIFSGRPQPRSKSWCFTMPSEKALTLPWNGLGGFLLSPLIC